MSTARAVALGALAALAVVGGVVAAFVTGVIELPSVTPPADEVLVILTAASDDSVEAPVAFVLQRGSSSAQILDPDAPVVISGTSASSAREAYPFVGGDGVARALSPQTAGRALPWVSVPPEEWASYVDRSGGVSIDLPMSISVYSGGRLSVLQEGLRTLTGAEAAALASALGYIEDERDLDLTRSQLSSRLAVIVADQVAQLSESVRTGAARSSIDAAVLGDFSVAP